jgi:mannose-6-phosphate isomerase-like protein (cupin superfamily)
MSTTTETTADGVRIVGLEALPRGDSSYELVGADHGGVDLSLILVDSPPGGGPSLHRHPYPEVFIVQEGEATFVAGDTERVVRAGEIVIVPAGVPHGFTNTGDGPLRQIDIHASARFATEWLDGRD